MAIANIPQKILLNCCVFSQWSTLGTFPEMDKIQRKKNNKRRLNNWEEGTKSCNTLILFKKKVAA
jgi:hypothetical protein